VTESQAAICRIELPTLNEVEVVRRRFEGSEGPWVAIVSGIRGDTPESIRSLYQVTRMLRQLDGIRGRVDLYPCANPLAAYAGLQRWPFFDVDLNRRFPGREHGHPPDRVAYELVRNIRGADLVIELRGAYRAFREIFQAHVRAGVPRATELAGHANVEVVWERTPDTMAPTTFAAQFETVMVLEGGAGNRLSEGVSEEMSAGVMNVLAFLGVVDEQAVPVHWAAIHRPQVVNDDQVLRVRAELGGLFMPSVEAGESVTRAQELGTVIDPLQARVLQRVEAPVAGRVLSLREQPSVHPGSLVARVVADAPDGGS
jgi:predicted deacylase